MKSENFEIKQLENGLWSASADVTEPRQYHIEFKGKDREELVNKLIDYLNNGE